MAGPKTYVGVSSKARQVKNIYVGVSSVARKVKKVYAGVGGKARLVYSSDWWLPGGMSLTNCICAYDFVKSQTADITGHGYPVYYTANSTYSSTKGWLVNDCLENGITQAPTCVVLQYSDMSATTTQQVHVTAKNGVYMMMRLGSYNYFWNGAWLSRTVNYPVFCMTYSTGNKSLGYYRGNSAAPTSGVIAFDRHYPAIYVNGSSIGVTSCSDGIENINNLPIATGVDRYAIGGGASCDMYIKKIAFYSTQLTAQQHAEIASSMAST